MAFETIEVVAAGHVYRGWKSIEVLASWEAAARTFTLGVSDVSDAPLDKWPLFPGTPVQVYASGSLVVNGFIGPFQVDGGPQNHDLSLEGQALSFDMVKSYPLQATKHFEDKAVLQIVQELVAPLGVIVEMDPGVPPPLVRTFQVKPSESIWAECLRLLQGFGLTLRGDADGVLRISKGETGRRHPAALIQGQNILRMSARFDDTARYSQVTVIGQHQDGVDLAQLNPLGIAYDAMVKRLLPKVIVDQAATTPARALLRAQWEVQRAAIDATTVTISTPGWHNADALWQPGNRVFVAAPWLSLEQDMLIKSATFSQDDHGGSTTTLELTTPLTGVAASKSAPVYGTTRFGESFPPAKSLPAGGPI